MSVQARAIKNFAFTAPTTAAVVDLTDPAVSEYRLSVANYG